MVKNKNLAKPFAIIGAILLSIVLMFSFAFFSLNNRQVDYASADTVVSDLTWSSYNFTGTFQPSYSRYIWSAGVNYYYDSGSLSSGGLHKKLDLDTNTWVDNTWVNNVSLSSVNGEDVFVFGNYGFYVFDSTLYLFDCLNNTINSAVVSGDLTYVPANAFWSAGDKLFYSINTGSYLVTISTNSVVFTSVNFGVNFGGNYVFSYDSNYFYFSGTTIYKLDVDNYSYSNVTSNYTTNVLGNHFWSDGNNLFYSYNRNQYLVTFDSVNNAFSFDSVTWAGLSNFYGSMVRLINDFYYISPSGTGYSYTPPSSNSGVALPFIQFNWPNANQNLNIVSGDNTLNVRIGSAVLYPLLNNNSLSFTNDSYIITYSNLNGTNGLTGYKFLVTPQFIVGSTFVDSVNFDNLSNVLGLHFVFYSCVNANSVTFTTFDSELFTFSSYITSDFVPSNLNISSSALNVGQNSVRSNVMFSDSTGQMLVFYISYINSALYGFQNSFYAMPNEERAITVIDSSSYDLGYTAGYNTGYNTGYNEGDTAGYNRGYNAGESTGYNTGYSEGDTAGYNRGYSAGESAGYNTGYSEGVNAANTYTFFGLIAATIDAPISAITGLLNFSVFGVSMTSFVLGLITLAIALIILRIALKGGR